MIRIILCGCAGRMGREIIAAAEDRNDLKIARGVEVPGNRSIGASISGIPVSDDLASVLDQGDVMVDFTGRSAAMANLDKWKVTGRPCVIGATGFTAEEINLIRKISMKIPIFLAPNMSLAVNHLYRLVRETALKLADFEIEIIETHHRGKKDAPSGTAREIGRIIQEVRPGTRIVYGREGDVGERKRETICINSVRGGDVIGEHRVLFFSAGEFVELRHYATSRQCFAQGALRAVGFIHGRIPGLYGMKELLSIDNK
jgi:4-hydroxy-tetrahydrodipicolinate reductase